MATRFIPCALFLSVACLQLVSGQFFALPRDSKSVGEPYGRQSQCPQVPRLGAQECAGQRSTCWSPGVRDLDCPSSGLCCFNGCVNICEGPSREQPLPPPVQVLIPLPPPRSPERPADPCNPSPCGPGTSCSPSPFGNPICRCREGLVPKPDTITGCGPECTIDPDCRSGLVCQNQRCVEKPDPCNPSPCGPGAICSVNSLGNPICRCEKGLIPKPDTITGCGPECSRDSDCRHGLICENLRCVERPDPCKPSPCGPRTICMINSIGNPICRCEAGLIPKPDTITGCGPECIQDSDCRSGFNCEIQHCIEKKDPCNPSPCGPGATCMVNNIGNPICRCEPGLIPKPDTITGCGPECVQDPDCKTGFVCQNQKCIEKPDPCNPSPCGPGAICMVNNIGNPICRCEPGLIPKPDTITGCGPECVRDPDCKTGFICQNQKCIEKPDPCNPSPCGPGAICMVNSVGNPICRCETGLIPNPDTITGCKPECVVDPDCQTGFVCTNQKCVEKPDPCNPSPCGPGTMCMTNSFGNAICRCLDGLVPKPDTITGCQPECEVDSDCVTGFICKNQKCVEVPDPCIPNPCGPNAICTRQGVSGFTCSCPPGFLGDPKVNCIQGECQHDSECPTDKACEDYHCINPCKPETCQKTDFCRVLQHVPTCGFNFVEEPKEARETFVIGESYKPSVDQQVLSVRNNPVIGGAYQKEKESTAKNVVVIGSRHDDLLENRPGCGSGCSRGFSVIGADYRRKRRQLSQREILRKISKFYN